MVLTVSVALGDCRQLFTVLESEFYCPNQMVYSDIGKLQPKIAPTSTIQAPSKKPLLKNNYNVKFVN
jgi:hypothetical protein